MAGTASTVNARVAAPTWRFLAVSTARTRNVCGPSASPVSSTGDEQELNAPASTLQSNRSRSGSGEEKPKLVSREPMVVPCAGPESIVLVGGVRSTVNTRPAGGRCTLPARSMARTLNTYRPSARPA